MTYALLKGRVPFFGLFQALVGRGGESGGGRQRPAAESLRPEGEEPDASYWRGEGGGLS